jgi:CRISPR-associated protein Csd1
MILQALYDYYQRKSATLPQEGFELKEIKYVIVINRSGEFVDLQDLRENKKGKIFLLPKSEVRSGKNAWQKSSLLWDHYGYILAHPKDNTEEAVQMALKQNKTFVENIKSLPLQIKEDEGVNAVLQFYETDQIEKVKAHPNWNDCKKIPGCNMSFKLDASTELVPQRGAITNYIKSTYNETLDEGDKTSEFVAPCLITGESSIIARLHTPTPIPGGKSNARLVAFQINSGFDSYSKSKAYNAPVSKSAESAYTTALKHLISSKSNKVIVADTTIVYWAEKKTEEVNPEEMFAFLVAQRIDEDNPDKGVQIIESFIKSVYTGKLSSKETNHFYVLGLSPNAARISVRFWKAPSVEDFGLNIKKHFDDFDIVHGPKDHKYLSLYQILSSTALAYKMDNVSPNLAGAVIESIVDGIPYPRTLMQQCVRRIRAEQNINRTRAAILKAYLNRFYRIQKTKNKEITMSLDSTNTNVAYRIGRLFAVLEKIQETASPNLNATIRDRYYGAASTSPITVFPRLLTLKNSHLKNDRISKGSKVYYEKLIGEIISALDSFPTNLALNEQAHFAIGYYHQRQDFFVKKSEKEATEIESNNN